MQASRPPVSPSTGRRGESGESAVPGPHEHQVVHDPQSARGGDRQRPLRGQGLSSLSPACLVHDLAEGATSSDHPPPGPAARLAGGPTVSDDRRVQGALRCPIRNRRDPLSRAPHLRPPPRPLHRPGQDVPPAHPHGHCCQCLPPRRLVGRHPVRHDPPFTPCRPRSGVLTHFPGFASSYPSTGGRPPRMKMGGEPSRRQCTGRMIFMLRAGQQLDQGVLRHHPMSRPFVGSTQESI